MVFHGTSIVAHAAIIVQYDTSMQFTNYGSMWYIINAVHQHQLELKTIETESVLDSITCLLPKAFILLSRCFRCWFSLLFILTASSTSSSLCEQNTSYIYGMVIFTDLPEYAISFGSESWVKGSLSGKGYNVVFMMQTETH